jgi:hypothetical protein
VASLAKPPLAGLVVVSPDARTVTFPSYGLRMNSPTIRIALEINFVGSLIHSCTASHAVSDHSPKGLLPVSFRSISTGPIGLRTPLHLAIASRYQDAFWTFTLKLQPMLGIE